MEYPIDTTGVFAVLGSCSPATRDGEQKYDADTGLPKWRVNVAMRYPDKGFQAMNIGLVSRSNPCKDISENQPIVIEGLTFNETERKGDVIRWYTADSIKSAV